METQRERLTQSKTQRQRQKQTQRQRQRQRNRQREKRLKYFTVFTMVSPAPCDNIKRDKI